MTALRAAVVLPARYHSTRFPGKPLAVLNGKPLIEWVYRRAAQISGVSRVVVATDHEQIAAARVDGKAASQWSFEQGLIVDTHRGQRCRRPRPALEQGGQLALHAFEAGHRYRRQQQARRRAFGLEVPLEQL